MIGAGAAGMMAASVAGKQGARVALLDHADEPGKKILISGGGRCNFTHLETSWERYHSLNPRFCQSAFARYGAQDFLALVEHYKIAWHEKSPGQLFCDGPASQIVAMLQAECRAGDVTWYLRHAVQQVTHDGHVFSIKTSHGEMSAHTVILASGGLAVPKLGASDLSLRIAKQFGLNIIQPAPALVPLCLAEPFPDLAGVSLPVTTSLGKKGVKFTDGMVFTHRGLSGPAILQISSYRDAGQKVRINLLPGHDILAEMQAACQRRPRAQAAALMEALPARLARHWAQSMMDKRPLAEQPGRAVRTLAERLAQWEVIPSGTEGYAKAEVMKGGIDTRQLSSRSMEVQTVPGLYAIGEAVDMTGWLGGYNFQWAWSSGVAAGLAAAERSRVL